MTTTSFRRRAAAVATGTLAAGALSFVPAMAGLSAAHAAPTDLGYSCVMGGFGAPQTLDSTLSIEVGTPTEAVAPGAAFTSQISATLDMGTTAMGPVSRLSGTIDVAVLVAGESKTVTIPVAEWTPASAPLVFTGTTSSELIAPATAGDAPIEVGAVSAALTATVGMATAPVNVPCTADAGQDQKVGTVTVGDAPSPEVPAGVANAYDCEYSSFGAFRATFYTVLDTSVKATQGKKATVPVTSTLVWGEEWTAMAGRIAMTFRNGAAQASTSAGSIGLAFADTPVPAAGDPMVWNASGSLALDTSAAGVKTVVPADIALTVEASNRFTGGEYSAAELACTLVGDAATLGEINVAKAPVVAAAATKTAVKTAYAKKAKKLTATVTVTSAKAKPAGKATLVLKKGKKQVGKATVNIKKGSAKAVFKKIAKGNYKLTVKYAGNKNFKASSKTVTVKIK
ncbi:Ig-like domain repeat protein [Nocardioides ochotonae]|uniref:Ig-like domain repeat protein n=1 Tax=Nocardioides ochotonae TaxID=2685869 RepID=UPI00140E59A5|nr:Ig-like domain repeat protein [Nocardioides ochotonae]